MAGFGQGLKEFFVGKPGETMQFNRFTPQQQGLQNQSIQQLMSLLQGMQGQSGMQGQNGAMGQFNFEPIANRARSDFQTKTLPLLAERFSSLGSNRNSSGLQGEAYQGAQGLEEGLAALQSKYDLAARGQQNQLLSLLMSLASQPSFESAYRPSTSGFFGGLAQGAGQALGSLPLFFL